MSADSERQAGYYWVLFLTSDEVWELAEWSHYGDGTGFWSIPGDEVPYTSDELAEVDERSIEREPVHRPSLVGP